MVNNDYEQAKVKQRPQMFFNLDIGCVFLPYQSERFFFSFCLFYFLFMFARMMVKPKKRRKQRVSYFNFLIHGSSFFPNSKVNYIC
jgi:hypothetical protein